MKTYFDELEGELRPLFQAELADSLVFQNHIVSAYTKCFEFNKLVNTAENAESSFFYTPSLRGLCEDLITLKFFKKHSVLDKNKLLKAYLSVQAAEFSKIQDLFFNKNHPEQIVFKYEEPDKVIDSELLIVKEEWAKIGLNKDKKFPSVSHMATDAGMAEMYEYLYAATSEVVHFSPRNLLRAGWAENDSSTLHKYSSLNFHKYYSLFNKFYGAYLFVEFTNQFKVELLLTKKALNLIKEIKTELNNTYRWPELLTFEEMNVPNVEEIRFANAIIKMKQLAKENNISQTDTEEMIRDFTIKIKGK